MLEFGRIVIIIGIILVIVGLLSQVTPFGRLPGDIFVKRGNFTFAFPIVTSILLSIILTIIVNLFLRK